MRTLAVLLCTVSLSVLTKSQLTPASTCVFTPVNNKSFVENIYPLFNKDSDIKILEYWISFVNVSGRFDLSQRSSTSAFQPSRWYRTQGQGSSQLLLVFNYYYGLLKPLMTLSIDTINVELEVSPADCLDLVGKDEIGDSIRDFLLQDFHIDETAVKNPFTYSDDVEICTAHVVGQDGWGKLVYRCCGLDSDENLYCNEIAEDSWVWALRAFIITLTTILFLYFPILIPKGYRIYSYVYYPPASEGLKFNVILTRNPDKYSQVKSAQILRINQWNHMEQLKKSISGYAKDVVQTATVLKVNFAVCMNRLLAEGGSAVSVWRALFDAFVRCKIRHSDPLQDCCRSPACGDNCCHKCPPWKAWFRPVRTILVMAVLAAPSGPFLYAMSADGLEFQTLSDKIESLGLQRPFDFYAGSVFGKVFVGVLALMYVTHVLIIVIDGSTDENISRLYTEVLDVAEKKDKISKRVGRAQSYIKIACAPIKKCGVLIIPLWIVALCFLPVVAIISFLVHAPMLQVMIQGVRKLLQRVNLLKQKRKDKVKVFNACEIFCFFTTAIFVFIVMTIGANFLVNAVVVVIVTVIVQADLIYRVVPVVLILIIYIRDSYSRVGTKYDAYLGTILGTIRNKEAEDLRREALKPIENQQNKIFKILPEPIPFDPDDEVVTQSKHDDSALVANLPTCEEQKLFSLKNSNVRLHLKQLLLFFSRDDSLYMSKKFLFHCCTMTCAGAPGVLEENYIDATLQFAKIGVFLLFVFLVVMAYGSTYYISPTNHLFVTLVSGLIPLIIRNIFSSSPAVETVTTSNYRFEAQLNEKIESFCQSWDVEDIVLKQVEKAPSNSSTSTNPTDDLTHDVPTKHFQGFCVDLVLELGDESSQSFHSIPQPRWRSRHKIDSLPCDLSDSEPVPEDNIPNPHLHNEDRWRYADGSDRTQPNGRDGFFDNDRHRTEVARAHAEHTRSILADIDTHAVSNHLLTMFGIIPENSAAENGSSEHRGNNVAHTPRNDNDNNNNNNNNTSARRNIERDNHAVQDDTKPEPGVFVVDDVTN